MIKWPASKTTRRPASDAEHARAALTFPSDGSNAIARRRFLQGSLAVGGSTLVVPSLLERAALAGPPLGPDDRVIVNVFLAGGNDGLNTVVPIDDSRYSALRPNLALSSSAVLPVGSGLALNPNLARLKNRFDRGDVAIINGVGHPDDDHSHFTSMATWMAGRGPVTRPTGWLGRYLDGAGLDGLGGVAIGNQGVPLTIRGAVASTTALPSWGGLFGADRSEVYERLAVDAVSAIGQQPSSLGTYGTIVAQAFGAAVTTAAQVDPVYAESALPEDGLTRDMVLAARLINLNAGTRVVSVTLDGFDNHNRQRPDHDDLLADLDLGIESFFAVLSPALASRTTVMVFSEFGRRPESNDSVGTDHGTAGPMFVIGARVAGGLHGQQPSLTNLDSRYDLKHHVDFRSVYATVLGDWLQADDREILGSNFAKLDLFTTAGPGGFYDVNDGDFYADAVQWLSGTGITSGIAPGQFDPHGTVDRGQMVTFLWRYSGSPSGAPKSKFADVPAGAFYGAAVDWAAAAGVTKGTSANQFSPNQKLTRSEMAVFLWRLVGSPTAPAAGFTDVPRWRHDATAIDWMAHAGITTGTGAGRYSPNDPVTRGQMAVFLWRMNGIS